MLNKFTIFIILFTSVVGKYFIIGPGKITFLNCIPCKEYKNLPLVFNLTTRMYNKTTQLISFDFFVPNGLNDNITLGLKAYKIDNNIERNVFSIEGTGVCDSLNKYAGELWYKVEEHAGLPIDTCPIPPGNYSITDHYLDLDYFKIKVLLEGHFRTRVVFLESNKAIFCYDFEFKLEPRT